MKLELSTEEIKELQRIQKKDRFHRRRFVKAAVLLMLHRGLSMEDIQVSLTLDDNTIRRYASGFKDKGLKSYMQDGYIPFSGKLSEEQEELLVLHLDEHLYADAKSICAYVKAEFGIVYSVSGMTNLLHRLGFVYKKTKAIPSKAAETEQLSFLQETLPELLAQVNQGEAVVYYADGTHPTHNTKPSNGWIRKGADFEIDCNSGRKRVNVNAAVNAMKPEYLEYDIADSINAQSTKRLCQKLLRKHPRKTVFLICDNAGYNRNRKLQDWAQKQRIEFVFLPAYSPNLNLIERLWRLMRQKIMNSTYYEQFADFRNAIIGFLENIKSHKAEVRRLLTLSFRTVDGTSVHAQTTL